MPVSLRRIRTCLFVIVLNFFLSLSLSTFLFSCYFPAWLYIFYSASLKYEHLPELCSAWRDGKPIFRTGCMQHVEIYWLRLVQLSPPMITTDAMWTKLALRRHWQYLNCIAVMACAAALTGVRANIDNIAADEFVTGQHFIFFNYLWFLAKATTDAWNVGRFSRLIFFLRLFFVLWNLL